MSYNKTFQKDSNIGKNYNQSYVDIPYEMLQDKLEYLCKSNGILLAIQEESNTSYACFQDKTISVEREYVVDSIEQLMRMY